MVWEPRLIHQCNSKEHVTGICDIEEQKARLPFFHLRIEPRLTLRQASPKPLNFGPYKPKSLHFCSPSEYHTYASRTKL